MTRVQERMNREVSRLLAAYLEHPDHTQGKLAKLCRLSNDRISRLYRGIGKVGIDDMEALSRCEEIDTRTVMPNCAARWVADAAKNGDSPRQD